MTALTMAVLMFGLTVLVGTAQERVVNALKGGSSKVKRWSGLVLIAVGLWLIALAVWADFFSRLFPV